MNTILLKYAAEVEKTGSISKAADNLYMNQPNLSKAIRELEDIAGIAIFSRTSKGVVPTKKGKKFLSLAGDILSRVDALETLYKQENSNRAVFDVTCCPSVYIQRAFNETLKDLNGFDELETDFSQTSSNRVIGEISGGEKNIGVVRCKSAHSERFFELCSEKGLEYEKLNSFNLCAALPINNVLSKSDLVTAEDLNGCTAVFPCGKSPLDGCFSKKQTEISRRGTISVSDINGALAALSVFKNAYMLCEPLGSETLNRRSLVLKPVDGMDTAVCDYIIFRSGYHLSKPDRLFWEKLKKSLAAY